MTGPTTHRQNLSTMRASLAVLTMASRGWRSKARSQLPAAAVVASGAALLAAMGSLLETGLGTVGDDRRLLMMLPAILGGWALLIVTFGVFSAASLAVRQRARETSLLRATAATPAQVVWLNVVEMVAMSIPAAFTGLLPGLLLGRVLVGRLGAAEAIGPDVAWNAGVTTVGIGVGTAVLTAIIASVLVGRRAAATPAVSALTATSGRPTGLKKSRLVAGLVVTVAGGSMGISTLAREDGPLLSSTSGPAGVLAAIGLALFAPVIAGHAGRALAVVPSVAARLAGRSLLVKSADAGAVIAPLTLLVGVAAGTLGMQRIEDGRPVDPDAPQLATVNYLVVAAIVGFSLIASTHAVITATRSRARDLQLLSLTGATRRQILASMTIEALTSAATAVVLGAIAAVVAIIPFSLVRTHSAVPAEAIGLFALTAAVALATTVAATVLPARRLASARPAS